ncbi:MAG: hypothetical protein ABFD96_06110 [Armatimonadia bacterium]
MKPEDFTKGTMYEQAHRLRYAAIAQNKSGNDLDEKTAMWLVRVERKHDLLKEIHDHGDYFAIQRGIKLLGLPVRFTVGDSPDTPELQLVMEPVLFIRPGRYRKTT